MMKEAPFNKWGFYPIPVYSEKGGVAAILKQYNLMDIYREKGWEGLTPEAQNAINRLKVLILIGMIYYSEMPLLKNIISAFPEVAKR